METRPASTEGHAVYSSSPKHWDYLFYIDFETSTSPEKNSNLLASLTEFSIMWMRELGTYKASSSQLEVGHPDWSLADLAM